MVGGNGWLGRFSFPLIQTLFARIYCTRGDGIFPHLNLHVGDDFEDVELSDHRHEDGEAPEHRQHRQRQLLGPAETEQHVGCRKENKTQVKDLKPG